MSRKFNGSSDFAAAPVNLSYTKIATIAFWLKWGTFANNDALALEYGANFSTNSGILIDPNSSGGSFDFGFGNPGVGWIDTITRPSAAVWHHYVFVFDRTGPVNTAYLDGKLQSLSTILHNGSYNDVFGNNTAYIMSRSGVSLFGAGSMADLAIWNVVLTLSEAYQLFNGARPSAFRPQNLISFYPLDGISARSQADIGPYNRTATLTGTLRDAQPPALMGELPKLRHAMWALEPPAAPADRVIYDPWHQMAPLLGQ